MNGLHAISVIALATLLLLPAVLMTVRWFWPSRMSGVAIIGILMLGGWLLVNVQLHVRLMYLGDIVASMSNPDSDDPLVNEWMADGPKAIVALGFGWLCGPILWLLWGPVFAVAWGTRWLVKRRRRHTCA